MTASGIIVMIDETFNSLVRECLSKFHLSPEENFSVFIVEWSDRYQTKFGTALYHPTHNSALIRISKKIWDRATKIEQKEVVWREVCHIVDHYFLKTKGSVLWPSTVGHGHYWQQLMLRIGLEPKRCHKVPVGDVTIFCSNKQCVIYGKRYSITKHRATRWKNARKVHCSRCSQPLVFITNSEQ